jgi:16S rRNA (uracil1498-N3)-methyltransferase
MSLRVFHRCPMQPGDVVTLDATESHYLARVRRARPGARIEVLDGIAHAFAGEVVDADAHAATIRIGDALVHEPCPPIEIAIGLPDPKAALDAAARACELGAARIVLLRCEYAHGAAPGPDRIRRVLEAALRQCGRPDLPAVEGPLPLPEWLERDSLAPGFVASTKLRGRPTPIEAPGPAGARVLVGPEGGLTDAEIELAHAHGLQPLSLGPWTLRTEVAVAVALALVVHGSGHRHGQAERARAGFVEPG